MAISRSSISKQITKSPGKKKWSEKRGRKKISRLYKKKHKTIKRG